MSLASSDLLNYVEPLPLDQIVFHSADTVWSWPAAAWDELLAVAHRDKAVAGHNLADLTLYLDNQSTHLAACAGAMDNSIPTDVGGNFSMCARWDPVGPCRISAGSIINSGWMTQV